MCYIAHLINAIHGAPSYEIVLSVWHHYYVQDHLWLAIVGQAHLAFLGQPSDMPPACSNQGFLPEKCSWNISPRRCLGSILARCSNHLNWLLHLQLWTIPARAQWLIRPKGQPIWWNPTLMGNKFDLLVNQTYSSTIQELNGLWIHDHKLFLDQQNTCRLVGPASMSLLAPQQKRRADIHFFTG